MKKIRGGTHTTLTETAELVVNVLEKIDGVRMISPGVIGHNSSCGGKRHVTVIFTSAGLELIISGQGVQKVAVHCDTSNAPTIFTKLRFDKKLSAFTFKARDKKPGI